MTEVLEWMRVANIPLGVLAVAAAAYRLVPLVWVAVRTGRRISPPASMLVVLFLYVVTAPIASAQATALNAPVGPVTLLRFAVHVALLYVCIRWRDEE